MKKIAILFLFFAITFSAQAIEPAVKALVEFETRGNATALRSNEMRVLEHYEIPTRLLEKDIAERMPADIRASLLFQKNGEEYIRWIVNPEDTKYKYALRRFLQKHNLPEVKYKYFRGYQTASRSYIVEDLTNKAQFSLKVSTNVTGGHWKDKKQTAEDATEVRRITDYVMNEGKRESYQHFSVMDEPAAFKIEELDQGMIVRLLNDLPQSDHIYLPGFSAVNDQVGKAIALKNGSLDPFDFWNTHYNKPLGKALAELAARTGVAYDSPHSQNFLIELDLDLKPTGKIILRDLGDAYITPEIARANGANELLKLWSPSNVKSGHIRSYVGIFHGTPYPSWMNSEKAKIWADDFLLEYNQEISRITGVPLNNLPKNIMVKENYFRAGYSLNHQEWKAYLEKLKKEHASETPSCPAAYGKLAS